MSLATITDISKKFNVSTRTLRYYEQIGLLQSDNKEGYAYRAYDETQIEKLWQILILRKLRIPLKDIISIFNDKGISQTLDILTQNMRETENEVNYLKQINDALNCLIEKLRNGNLLKANLKLMDENGAIEAIVSLLPSKTIFKENGKLSNATQPDQKLKDVRIIYLPPTAVAAYQYEGDNPEDVVGRVVDRFAYESKLYEKKPDLRHFGFNAPNPVDETGRHGYEMWVTVPDDFDVPAPLIKKHFEGGMYAAHMINFGAFEEWDRVVNWVHSHDKYAMDNRGKGSEVMYGLLEEHLNYLPRLLSGKGCPETVPNMQLDLLVPIKEVK